MTDEEILQRILDDIGLNTPDVHEVQIKVWGESDVYVVNARYDAINDAYDIHVRSSAYPAGYHY